MTAAVGEAIEPAAALVGNVLHVRCVGASVDQVLQSMDGRLARAIVLDMRACCTGMLPASDSTCLPVALIVDDVQPAHMQHALKTAHRGVMCRVFVDELAALAWATAEAVRRPGPRLDA